jgi:Spy/CpxP family protein refolding chaperone
MLELKGHMTQAREALAKTLEDPNASDQTVMEHVDRVAEAHHRLERRAAEHLLKIRGLLTPEQRAKLLDAAASAVRQVSGPWAGAMERFRQRLGGEGPSARPAAGTGAATSSSQTERPAPPRKTP